MERPKVIVHVAVSLDGATTGFTPDVERFYTLATTWQEDLTLAGADTILAQEPALAGAPRPGPAQDGPVLAVVDSRRRVSAWTALRECGHWSDVIALRSESTTTAAEPAAPRAIRAGRERVDLAEALGQLWREGFRVARVDSGGGLAGALLHAGLADEISLLVHALVAGRGRRWWGDEEVAGELELVACERLEPHLAWLRYRTTKSRPLGAALQ